MADCCSGDVKMIYPCSGAADVGELADRVARTLRDEGFAKMSCLAGIGADLSGYVQTARGADVVITVDGCVTACAKNGMKRIGVVPLSYVLTDMGLEKGKTAVTDVLVSDIADRIASGMSGEGSAPGGC
ncbi:MAG: putative zinc-binding protein [Spirochaetes bacterium]|nr:putative zinc-binding protein [Spirochaetota bacterium]